MKMKNNTKLDFNDILIVPSVNSEIESRKEIECNYVIKDKYLALPIIAAPMDTVVDKQSSIEFAKNGINICAPRGSNVNPNDIKNIMCFKSYGLDEFIEKYIKENVNLKEISGHSRYILIDIANGHMFKLEKAVIDFRKKYGNKFTLMVGNVANFETYKRLSDAGADFIRVGIGNGNGCLTTQQTGVGYPMASLIHECYYASLTLDKPAKIVADGGMKSYSDIIKALALGADYVMIGSMLNKCLESAGDTKFMGIKIPRNSSFTHWLFNKGYKLTKSFRGMSTKEVQKKWGKENLKTSEGVVRTNKVEYTIKGWSKNFTDYLKSAMSYSDSKRIEEFINNTETIEISNSAYKRFNK
jgi:IMP dehydrogenase/GMP reductase